MQNKEEETNMETWKQIVKKLLSGRLWLTIIAGAVFAYATYAKVLEPQAISAILVLAFTSYFNKKTNNGD